MRIKVLPPPGCDRSCLDERGWADVSEGAKVSDVLKMIHCGSLKARLLLVSVNGEHCSMKRELKDGDVIGFFMPVSGG